MDTILGRGGRAAALLLALLLVVTGCTGLPTSGEVHAGKEPGAVAEELPTRFFAGAPSPGATPEEIVTGFIEASISPLDSWEIARMYLGGELKQSWRPEAGVIVDVADERRYTVPGADPEDEEAESDRVALTVDATAVVDEHGTYTSSSGPVEMAFRLAQRQDGEWRIVEAPDGIVIDRQSFRDVYGDHRLTYFDPTWTYLIPDVRWFPATGNAATYIVRELVNGAPSAWLAGSVASAFAQDIELEQDAVPVDADQVAHVGLNAVAAGVDETAKSRMMTQLLNSLTTAGVQSVRLTIDGQTLPVDVEAFTTAQTRPDPRALVLRAGEFGFLSGADMVPIEGLSPALVDMEGQIDSIAVDPSQEVAVVQQSTGIVYRVTAESPDQVDAGRKGLIRPLIDPFGYVWTVPGNSPTEIISWDADLQPIAITGGFAEAATVRAWAMSRDGGRMAALVTQGGEHFAVVASIRRDRSGKPSGVGGVMRTTELPLAGVDIAWIEDSRLGIVMSGTEGEQRKTYVIDQQVGGPATRVEAPVATTAIEFGTQDSLARLQSSDGLLYLRRQTSWQQAGDGVSVLATQMGTPRGDD
ncbi:GerMN domain-containing protein [Microbacterium phosphatis]|uniref:GerMN domain-containing protein n=1 Tax=Microbacterium phosphatis TaxID=3140248 RepID=UPI0031404114